MLALKAPRGTWVTSLPARDNDIVSVGEQIMILDFSPDIRYRAHLAERKRYSEAALGQLSSENIDSMASALDAKYDALSKAKEYSLARTQYSQNAVKAGLIDRTARKKL
jgi:hypothetical protein